MTCHHPQKSMKKSSFPTFAALTGQGAGFLSDSWPLFEWSSGAAAGEMGWFKHHGIKVGMAKTSGKDNDYSNMAFCGHYLLSQAYQDDTGSYLYSTRKMDQLIQWTILQILWNSSAMIQVYFQSIPGWTLCLGLPVAGGWVFRLRYCV